MKLEELTYKIIEIFQNMASISNFLYGTFLVVLIFGSKWDTYLKYVYIFIFIYKYKSVITISSFNFASTSIIICKNFFL